MSDTELCQRLREGIDVHDPIIVAQAETDMVAAADELDRLRAGIKRLSETTNVCVFYLLNEICAGCRCPKGKRVASTAEQNHEGEGG